MAAVRLRGTLGEPSRVSSRAYAARAPRRRARQRVGPSRVRWDRVGRVALVMVLFGVMVSYLNPVVNLIDAWSDAGASKERLAELKYKHEKLLDEVRDASSPLTVEREARKLGMVRPGEHAYVVHDLGQ